MSAEPDCILCALPPYHDPSRERVEVFAYGFVAGALSTAQVNLCAKCGRQFREAVGHYAELAKKRVHVGAEPAEAKT